MAQRVSFTKTFIESIPAPAKGRRSLHDAQVPGLLLCITGTGAKSFYVRRKVRGRSERFFLGRYPDLAVEQARNRAREVLGQVAAGLDPMAIRKPRSKEATFAEGFAQYIETYAKLHKRSWREDEAQYRRYMSQWGARRISSISRAEVMRHHAQVGTNSGPYAANRMLALISKLYGFWGDAGIFTGPNVAKGLRKFTEHGRRRFMGAEELSRLFSALREEPNEVIKDFILMALFTGQRRANVCAMRWDQIDLDAGRWEIPMTKNGTAHTVPLPTPCVNILKARLSDTTSEFVFPGSGRSGHLVEPKSAWKRVLDRAGLHDLRIHDLRHTLASWQAGMGVSLPIIAKTLNHASTTVTQRYAHLHNDVVREALGAAVDAMLSAGANGDRGHEEASGETEPASIGSERRGRRTDDGGRLVQLGDGVDRC